MRPAWMARILRWEEPIVSMVRGGTSDDARDRSMRSVKPVSRASIFPTSPSRFSWILTGGTASLSFDTKSRSRSAFQPGSIRDTISEIRIRTTYIVFLESIIVTVCTILRPRNRNLDRGQRVVNSNEIKRKLANYLVSKRLTPLGLSSTWTTYQFHFTVTSRFDTHTKSSTSLPRSLDIFCGKDLLWIAIQVAALLIIDFVYDVQNSLRRTTSAIVAP